MNTDVLNGPLEVGIRALTLLSHAFPNAYDIDSIAFFDYTLLHSSELGGPSSINPDVPNHRTEIAIKRDLLELGLQVMIRAKLIGVQVDSNGIGYSATDNGPGFVDLLESSYMQDLRTRAEWVMESFGQVDPTLLHARVSELISSAAGLRELEPDEGGTEEQEWEP